MPSERDACFGRKLFGVIVLAMAMSYFIGCGSECDSPTSPKPPSRSHPDSLLEYIIYTYVNKDAEGYAECLHEEYVCRDADWWEPGDPPLLEFDRDGDVSSTSNLFSHPPVDGIEMEFEKVTDWAPADCGGEDCLAIMVEPIIRVVIGESDQMTLHSSTWMELKDDFSGDNRISEPCTVFVHQTHATLYVMPDAQDSGLWVVFEMEEGRAEAMWR